MVRVPGRPNPNEITFEQNRLRSDMEVVQRYGQSHPESWVQTLWANEPSVRIVAILTGNGIADHESALRDVVENPDQLEVRWVPWTFKRLEEIRAEVTQMAQEAESGVFGGWGIGEAVVEIRLRADQEDLARRLVNRYGGAVDLTVGFLPFSIEPSSDAQQHPRGVSQFERPRLLPSGEVEVSLRDPIEVRSGRDVNGHIVVRNTGPDDLVVNTNGHVTAHILDPKSQEIIGAFSGGQGMPLIRFTARPGEAVEIPILIGTACPQLRLGYATPPGKWILQTVLSLEGKGDFRVAGLPITVLA